jgi:hypothetical protein
MSMNVMLLPNEESFYSNWKHVYALSSVVYIHFC